MLFSLHFYIQTWWLHIGTDTVTWLRSRGSRAGPVSPVSKWTAAQCLRGAPDFKQHSSESLTKNALYKLHSVCVIRFSTFLSEEKQLELTLWHERSCDEIVHFAFPALFARLACWGSYCRKMHSGIRGAGLQCTYLWKQVKMSDKKKCILKVYFFLKWCLYDKLSTNSSSLLTDSVFVTGVFAGHHLHPSGLQLYCFLNCRKKNKVISFEYIIRPCLLYTPFFLKRLLLFSEFQSGFTLHTQNQDKCNSGRGNIWTGNSRTD